MKQIDSDPLSDLAAQYLEELGKLADQAHVSRRTSKNQAIVEYIIELHSIWMASRRESSDLARPSMALKAMSKSVSMLLEPSLMRLGKAILSERDPHFEPTDDGDSLGDEFTAAILTRYHQLKEELSASMDPENTLYLCMEDVRAAILVEFDRQASNSWAV